jgi:hypothetical protein
MAAQPWYYTEQSQPKFWDTKIRVWTKVLGIIQSRAGANPANDPKPEDTFRRIQEKINKATI